MARFRVGVDRADRLATSIRVSLRRFGVKIRNLVLDQTKEGELALEFDYDVSPSEYNDPRELLEIITIAASRHNYSLKDKSWKDILGMGSRYAKGAPGSIRFVEGVSPWDLIVSEKMVCKKDPLQTEKLMIFMDYAWEALHDNGFVLGGYRIHESSKYYVEASIDVFRRDEYNGETSSEHLLDALGTFAAVVMGGKLSDSTMSSICRLEDLQTAELKTIKIKASLNPF